ncbi:dynamin [Reticulomyxa filosa]|uniref:Dynamin n=1 Tax=Reticulomyxa filosa TaxID=46433 RepID=X6NV44_RETFI|nr:dynamin [Reticulomyxa filosa]|eukprot:ETO30185.1 dynamin [Reticulomyxa filosa]
MTNNDLQKTVLEEIFSGKKGAQKMINLFDEIRSKFPLDKDLKIPSIVVIGDQSHGKSSLLELISGIELPKGEGMVTRVPLELRLRNIDEKKSEEQIQTEDEMSVDEYVEIEASWLESGEKKKKFLLNETEKAVKEYTQKAIDEDDKRSVAEKPIIMTVFKKNTLDLTLIDLPGIIRNPGVFDDPSAPDLIKKMINHYVSREEVIILNVLQCGDDPQTCESMRISYQLDKAWARTLLVYTKIDKEEISSVISKYKGLITSYQVPTENIFFVRNRSHDDLHKAKMTLRKAQDQESWYFEKNKTQLEEIPNQCLGSVNLAGRLHQLLKGALKKLLPDITQRLETKEKQLQKRKKELGDELEEKDKQSQLRRFLEEIFDRLNRSINTESNDFTLAPTYKIFFKKKGT